MASFERFRSSLDRFRLARTRPDLSDVGRSPSKLGQLWPELDHWTQAVPWRPYVGCAWGQLREFFLEFRLYGRSNGGVVENRAEVDHTCVGGIGFTELDDNLFHGRCLMLRSRSLWSRGDLAPEIRPMPSSARRHPDSCLSDPPFGLRALLSARISPTAGGCHSLGLPGRRRYSAAAMATAIPADFGRILHNFGQRST